MSEYFIVYKIKLDGNKGGDKLEGWKEMYDFP